MSSYIRDFLLCCICNCFLCVYCVGLVASTCQVIGLKDSVRMPISRGAYLHKHQAEENFSVFLCCFSLLFDCVFVPGPIQYISFVHGTI